MLSQPKDLSRFGRFQGAHSFDFSPRYITLFAIVVGRLMLHYFN